MFEGKNFALIKANRLFAGTTQKVKISLSNKDFLSVSPGDIIYEANEAADAIYLIISGEVKIEVPGIFKKPVIVKKSVKDFFGEKEFVDNEARKGKAEAVTSGHICILKKEKLDKLFTQDRQVFLNLYGIQDDKAGEIEGFAFQPAAEVPADSEIESDESIKEFLSDQEPEEFTENIQWITDPELSENTPQDEIQSPEPELKSEVRESLPENKLTEEPAKEQKSELPDITDISLNGFDKEIENAVIDEDEFKELKKTISELPESEDGVVWSELHEFEEEKINNELADDFANSNMTEDEDPEFLKMISSEDEKEFPKDTTEDIIDFDLLPDAPEPLMLDDEKPVEETEDLFKVISDSVSLDDLLTSPASEIKDDLIQETDSTVDEINIIETPEIHTNQLIETPEKPAEQIPATPEEPVEQIPEIHEEPAEKIPADKKISDRVPEISEEVKVIPEPEKIESSEVTGEFQIQEKVEEPIEKIKKPDEPDTKESHQDIIPPDIKDNSQEDLLDSLLLEPQKKKVKVEKPRIKAKEEKKTTELKPAEAKAGDSNKNKELSEEVDEMTAAQFKQLLEAAQKINSSIKLDETLESILSAAKQLTGAEHGYLYLLDLDAKELWAKALNNEVEIETRLKIGEDVAGIAAEKNEIINIKNAYKDPRFNKERDKKEKIKTKNILCFPIVNKSGFVSAVLQLSNSSKGEFTTSDVEALSALSMNISLALENAELVEKQFQNDRLSSMGKMANFIIQDIKKPVLTIKYYAEHLKKKEVSSETVQVLNMLIEQSNAVVDLVQTTLSYSEGKGIHKGQPVRLSTALNDIFNLLAEYVESRHVNLFKKYEGDAVVNIDKRELYQACFQIVKNGCDAMPGGGDIYVLVKLENNVVKIEFKDTGVGVPESIKGRIFEPFMSHGKKQGVGLGLAIAEKIVKDHGGTILFESEVGEGTTFTISMPYISVV